MNIIIFWMCPECSKAVTQWCYIFPLDVSVLFLLYYYPLKPIRREQELNHLSHIVLVVQDAQSVDYVI